jgi:hypothetical protein
MKNTKKSLRKEKDCWNKCRGCGRFISFDDMQDNKAKCNFTPDSHYSVECVEWICADCLDFYEDEKGGNVN